MNARREILVRLMAMQAASEQLDAMAVATHPHDCYRQTVFVMGYDPLGEMGAGNEIQHTEHGRREPAPAR